MSKGTIYMIPTTLGGESTLDIVPEEVRQITIGLRTFIVEDIKSARRFLRKLDRAFPIDESTFHVLNKKTDRGSLHRFIDTAVQGGEIGVMSEAGCPGVADPGAEIVSLAHQLGLRVHPFVGPSSILLTLMGSGFSGQNFSFHGYLPKDRRDRVKALKEFEHDTRKTKATHLFMDTPFRNVHVLEDMLNELADNTQICVASNITLPDASIRTMSVKDWRDNTYDIGKRPTMFAIGTNQ
ncbi:MAG: hypothetical protein A3D92_20830 [Bacteroidetes bacterium RIFCSPHIGHO2_02_FULL_44_7]|nr:MAG: hypothetical protein A3D92_20830 [Bacteroidetes bacterium RIFCSPHIGHO2_02_FULL_44_7]